MKDTNQSVLFAHSGGAQGSPGEGSFDFVQVLKKGLGPKYTIHYPIIEDTEAPTYGMWKVLFEEGLKMRMRP